jgi:hypothetical protein
VTGFYQAKKKYSILQSKQEQPSAFLLFVLTCWGTQYLMIKSLLQNKSALYLWVADSNAQIGKKKGEIIITANITSPSF